LGGGAGGGGQRDHRHAAIFGRRDAFERDDVGELGIVGHDADGLGGVDRRAAADRDDEVGPGGLEGGETAGDVGDGRVLFDVVKHDIGHAGRVEDRENLGGHAEFDELLVGDHEGFFEAAALDLVRENAARAGT